MYVYLLDIGIRHRIDWGKAPAYTSPPGLGRFGLDNSIGELLHLAKHALAWLMKISRIQVLLKLDR